MSRIRSWVEAGGHVCGTTAAGSRNEFNEPVAGLSEVFGIEPSVEVEVQQGRYHIRGALNGMSYLDRIKLSDASSVGQRTTLGVIGSKVTFTPTAAAEITGTFQDGSAAIVGHDFGKGKAVYIGACPGVAYIKEAKFVPAELKETWPAFERGLINATARRRGVRPLVELSHPVVEAGLYDCDRGTALVLANFTYRPIEELTVRLYVPKPYQSAVSAEQGRIRLSTAAAADGHPPGFPYVATFTCRLGLSDVIIVQ